MKNKMDLSMGVAVGSSAQVSLFVVPFIVIYGWIKDIDMTLNFPPFEIMLYVLVSLQAARAPARGENTHGPNAEAGKEGEPLREGSGLLQRFTKRPIAPPFLTCA